MNVKKATNSQLSTTESEKKRKEKKNPLGKQPEQEENHRYRDHLEGYQLGRGRGRMGEVVQGIRSIIGRYKKDKGELKNSRGNGEPKKLHA